MSLAFLRGIHQSQMVSNAENISISWRHHEILDDKATFVQVMACCHQAKPLPDAMLTQICVKIWCHLATMIEVSHWNGYEVDNNFDFTKY